MVEAGQGGIAIRVLGGTRAGEIRLTRFLRNPRVNIDEMVATAAQRTAARVSGRHILAIQDTTSLRDDGAGRSLQAHPTIAVDAESGSLLGLVHAELLSRRGGLKEQRRSRGFDDKQSRRWLTGAEAAAGLCAAGAAHVTVVADRESDIYEALALKPGPVDLVIRAAQDRALEQGGRLFACLAQAPEAGRFTVDLAAAPGRASRTAAMSVRFGEVTLKRPVHRPAGAALPETVSVSIVEVRELDPPPGTRPAHWRLLTTHRVDSFAKARWIAGLYRRRWVIEELFRTIKSKGFDIERVGIAEGPFEKLAIVTILAGITVLSLVRERDGGAGRPLADVFEPDEFAALEAASAGLEGKTARQKNPHRKGSLAFAAWVCARLGGWTGYYGKPGPVVMLKGLHRFRAMQQGWSLARNV